MKSTLKFHFLLLNSLYNDIYNFKTGKFDSMTPDMLKLYNSNLKQFYKSFTGSSYMPDSITQFEDIRLRDYFNQAGCKNGLFNEEISSNENNNHLFKKYISSIKLMIDTISSAHNKLVIIIKKLFVYKVNTKTSDRKIIINPNLTDELLKEITISTIDTISHLYLNCEKYFHNLNIID